MALGSYTELISWQKARHLVKDVYSLCGTLPKQEQYGLCSQMQRAAVSIPSNIAEGYRRNNRGEYIQFLGIAAGSAAELETQLLLVNDLYGIDTAPLIGVVNEVQKMLTVMIRKLDPKR
jgi:four helix bundle protein